MMIAAGRLLEMQVCTQPPMIRSAWDTTIPLIR